MGSHCEIMIRQHDSHVARSAIKIAVAEIKRLEKKYNFYNPSSYLNRINTYASRGPVEIDDETADLFAVADVLVSRTSGFFDPTIGAVTRHIDFKKMVFPNKKIIDEALRKVGWKQYVETSGNTLQFHNPEVCVDFGGIVKEYGADRACSLLKSLGIGSALINLGGDIICFSEEKRNIKPWKIGVADPRDHQKIAEKFPIFSGTIVTSGDYHRYFYLDGIRYHHIINPKSGFPLALTYSGVTFVTKESALGTSCQLTEFYSTGQSSENIPKNILGYYIFDNDGESVTQKKIHIADN